MKLEKTQFAPSAYKTQANVRTISKEVPKLHDWNKFFYSRCLFFSGPPCILPL